jgi:hypothetical protein
VAFHLGDVEAVPLVVLHQLWASSAGSRSCAVMYHVLRFTWRTFGMAWFHAVHR